MSSLAKAGHPTFAVDTRGYGRTDKPNIRISRGLLAEDIRQFCITVGLHDVAIVGHDWGGLIAFKAAIDHPEMFTRLALIDSTCTVITPDITHPYWFKAAPFPETFLAEHGADMIEVRLGGKPGRVLGPRPNNGYGDHQVERQVDYMADEDIAHYISSLDRASQANAIQYYRYAMPIHRVLKDPNAPFGEYYQVLSEDEVTSMWLHPDGYDEHPWRHEFHDIAPEDRQKQFLGPATLIYGRQFSDRFPNHADDTSPSGDPFADQYTRYMPDLKVYETGAGHYIPEELPDVVSGALLDLLDRG